ncbi:MAG: sel1 repeat family protein [Alphaproteobacteria bacterium]|nr:sel1 repeat family protein [Alphaproteobacteria bacterium]
MKFVTLVFFFFLIFLMPASANESDLFNAMLILANKGDPEAQYHMGMMYNNGIGTKKDPKQAFEWFKKSGSSNDPLGAYKLGCYYDGQGEAVVKTDSKEALNYKLISAKAGYMLAQHDVANHYGKQGNWEEAIKWWKMAGNQGFPKALYNLSKVYYEGKGAVKDLSLAYAYFKLSKLASESKINNNAQAMLNEVAAKMSNSELNKAEMIVSKWTPKPTALTIKAMSGFKAAEEYLQQTKQ